jgi:poly(ADP-ribose) glycohydrolase
MKMNDIFY